MDDTFELPIFPLNTVLLPGGALPLKIFEPRYLEMVSRCERDGTCFAICLIKEGKEVGKAASFYPIGTQVSISFWQQRKDGLLGITVRGEHKIEVLQSWVDKRELVRARVKKLAPEPTIELPEQYQPLSDLLAKLIENLGHPYVTLPKFFDDANWVGARLSEILPAKLALKQSLLQLDDPLERLALIQEMLRNSGLL